MSTISYGTLYVNELKYTKNKSIDLISVDHVVYSCVM